MGCASRQSIRRVPLVITILAMIGMELDVLCHPSSPSQVHRSIQASNPDERDANSPRGVKASDSGGRDAFVERSIPIGQQSGPTKNRSKLNMPAGMQHRVAIRSKTRLSELPLISICITKFRLLNVVLPGDGSEHHFHPPHRVSLLRQLCRMLC